MVNGVRDGVWGIILWRGLCDVGRVCGFEVGSCSYMYWDNWIVFYFFYYR